MVNQQDDKAFMDQFKKQFGTKGVSKKIWFVLSDNKWFVPGFDGCIVSRVHGETAQEATVNFKRLHNSHRLMGVFESFEAAKKAAPYIPMVLR
jgi:hypothetical protein